MSTLSSGRVRQTSSRAAGKGRGWNRAEGSFLSSAGVSTVSKRLGAAYDSDSGAKGSGSDEHQGISSVPGAKRKAQELPTEAPLCTQPFQFLGLGLFAEMTPRITRSRSSKLRRDPNVKGTRRLSQQASRSPDRPLPSEMRAPAKLVLKGSELEDTRIRVFPLAMKRQSYRMNEAEYDLLHAKAKRLKESAFQQALQTSGMSQVAAAILVFAQYEAGTAVCISPNGVLLTCAHCVHDADVAGSGIDVKKWLIFGTGQTVLARCRAWDPKCDLALLQVTAVQPAPSIGSNDPNWASLSVRFAHIPVSTVAPRYNDPLTCIGHPDSRDLEASTCGVVTDYDVLHISSGRFRGLAKGQDPQDNREIGALKHDCWTYWGHSGAPLVDNDGRLIGLHSSWDDETGMRRGIPLQAVRAFLGTWVDGLEE